MTVRIIDKSIGINKKLGNIKFEDAFDTKNIHDAEKMMAKSTEVFKKAAIEDHQELNELFKGLTPEWLDIELLKKISDYAFSIKSRAGTGGIPIASEVANSMYKLCDEASKGNITENFDIIKLHLNALNEIFSGKFPANDDAKGQKLMSGLEALVKKIKVQ